MCVSACSIGDFVCSRNCFREYSNDLELCPCQSGCPTGCPCDDYECVETTTVLSTTTTAATTTTTTKAPSPATEVLILNTWKSVNVPIITNVEGREDRNFFFLYGEETEVKYSCSMTWKNEFYVFGGFSRMRHISKLIGCELKSTDRLAFDHFYGACANVGDEKLYLCFNDKSSDTKKCRVATSPTGVFEEINQSSFHHRGTRIAVSEGNNL